jgi:hypothetical protein
VALSPSKRAQTKGKDIPLTTASMFTPEGHVSAVVFFFFFFMMVIVPSSPEPKFDYQQSNAGLMIASNV